MMNLSEEDLLETARRRTGLSDWGGDSFRAGLRVLLESDNTEAHLSLLGKLAVRFEYLRSLCNRLRIQDTFNRHECAPTRIPGYSSMLIIANSLPIRSEWSGVYTLNSG